MPESLSTQESSVVWLHVNSRVADQAKGKIEFQRERKERKKKKKNRIK